MYRISERFDTEVQRYPWQVLLIFPSYGSRFSGVLIDELHVLTTAHGFLVSVDSAELEVLRDRIEKKVFKPCFLQVWLGVTAFAEVEEGSIHIQKREAVAITLHPDWKESNVFSGNDIAVVKLHKKVDITGQSSTFRHMCRREGKPKK